MSIINDALKKAGNPSQPEPKRPETGRLNQPILQPVPGARKKSSINWGPVFVLLVLTMITGPLIAPIFSSPYRSTSTALVVPSYRESLNQVSGNRQAQFAIEEAPRLAAAAPAAILKSQAAVLPSREGFVMNGIVYGDPASFCIINGKVVKVGEKVGGATLVAVTPEKATLKFEGKTIDLWVA